MNAKVMSAVSMITLLALALALGGYSARGESESEEKEQTWALAVRLTADTRARAVGDLLTVIIEEEAEASKAAQSSSSKSTAIGGDVSLGHPRLDARPTSWTNAVVPSWSLDTTRSFQGSGASANSDKLTTKIAARVVEVLPNGNLLIEGRRSMIVQDETVEIVLTGTVRQRDVAGDNTVESSRIADATIKYISNGPIVKNQKMGLFTRLWNWVNPF